MTAQIANAPTIGVQATPATISVIATIGTSAMTAMITAVHTRGFETLAAMRPRYPTHVSSKLLPGRAV
jgi:hypothetical protein